MEDGLHDKILEVKKIINKIDCNCGINCKCLQTQDFDDYLDRIDYLDYDLMANFSEK